MGDLCSAEREMSGSPQPASTLAGAAEMHEPSTMSGGGQDAGGAWFCPEGILVSRWAAEVGWMHHV